MGDRTRDGTGRGSVPRPGGRLTIEVRAPRGRVVARRRANNTVFLTGATLVGELFSGRVATPVNGMGVGTNPQPSAAPYETVTLDTADDAGQPLTGPLAVPLDPDDITVATDADELRVSVRIRGVLPPEGARAADGGPVLIGEAGLGVLSADGTALDRTYNRVTFEPIPKAAEHELALYWEVFFPYGP
jgi:hypothetical protein